MRPGIRKFSWILLIWIIPYWFSALNHLWCGWCSSRLVFHTCYQASWGFLGSRHFHRHQPGSDPKFEFLKMELRNVRAQEMLGMERGKGLEGTVWAKSHLKKQRTLCVHLGSRPSKIFVFHNLSLKGSPKTGHWNVGLDHLGGLFQPWRSFSNLGDSMIIQVPVLPLGGLNLVQGISLY